MAEEGTFGPMQSILDNLCRCFGTSATTVTVPPVTPENSMRAHNGHKRTLDTAAGSEPPSTPDMKRRTRSLSLKDKQWDNLFSQPRKQQTRNSAGLGSTPAYNIDHAQAVAKAKLVAAQPHTRRKRSRTSRDDIFRSKKAGAYVRNTSGRSSAQHTFNRFLSSHAVLAQSLCFATPVKDSHDDEPEEVPLNKNHSLTSDTNTLQTNEDTVTSTVYYENTKLAGLKQTNPPMPLFDGFQVSNGDDIHRIVATDSHSSHRMPGILQGWNEHVTELEEEEDSVEEPPKNDDVPPPMTHSSSESSRSSKENHRNRQSRAEC